MVPLTRWRRLRRMTEIRLKQRSLEDSQSRLPFILTICSWLDGVKPWHLWIPSWLYKIGSRSSQSPIAVWSRRAGWLMEIGIEGRYCKTSYLLAGTLDLQCKAEKGQSRSSPMRWHDEVAMRQIFIQWIEIDTSVHSLWAVTFSSSIYLTTQRWHSLPCIVVGTSIICNIISAWCKSLASWF